MTTAPSRPRTARSTHPSTATSMTAIAALCCALAAQTAVARDAEATLPATITPPAARATAEVAAPLQAIVDGYLTAWFDTFPSRATAAGLYDRDRRLEVLDAPARAAWIAFNRETATRLEALLAADDALGFDDRQDASLLLRQSQRVLFDWERRQRPTHDPLFWSGLLANATVMLTVREDRPAEARLAAAAARARTLPRLAATAREALASGDPARIPPEWVTMAAGQTRSAAGFYRDGLAAVGAAQAPTLAAELAAAGGAAADALETFAAYLDTLAGEAGGSPRLGLADYTRLFRLFTGDPRSPLEVLQAAQRALEAKRREAAVFARTVWPTVMEGEPPADDVALLRAVFRRVGDDHAESVEAFVEDFESLLAQSEAWVRERGLITLPDPLTVVTRRSPAYFAGQGVGGVYGAGPYAPDSPTLFYLPTPPDSLTPERREAFFRDFNHHFNVMITPHEMIPGHYLQGKIAAHHPRKVRSLFDDGVYVEGWGTFCERLMLDEGWGGPLDRLAHLKKQIENIARTIVDIRVHTSEVTREEVIAFVQEEALQEAHFAGNMWTRAITSTPQITSYWLGYRQHRDLYERVREARGEAFVLREYMDAMVAHGGIPVAAYAQILLDGAGEAAGTAGASSLR